MIEGTQTSMDEVGLNKEDITLESQEDWQEVQNYIDAMEWAIKELGTLSFHQG